MLYYILRPLVLISFLLALAAPRVYAEGTHIQDLKLSAQDRILVLAPHPDDEVLGCAGIIQKALAMKLPLQVVFFTYGDSNQWSFFLYRHHPVVMPGAVEKMGLVRHDEAMGAARILGVDPSKLIFLGYPDFGTLNIWYYHWDGRPAYRSLLTRVRQVPYKDAFRPGAPYKGEAILKDLGTILKEFKPTKIFVSHPADHNGDHLALYLFLRVALWNEGMDHVQIYPYLIHYLSWPKPKGFHPEIDLKPPASLADTETWYQDWLTPEAMAIKENALEAHATQFRSTPKYLLSFVKYNELFGQIQDIHLHMNENSSVFSAKKSYIGGGEMPEELNAYERSAFIGVDWRFLRWEKGQVVVSIQLSRPLAQDVEASIYFFGYSDKIPFGEMPKINVRLGVLSYNVYNQTKKLDQNSVKVERTPSNITITVPLKLLGDPQRILTSARTYLGNLPLDSASWVAVELD